LGQTNQLNSPLSVYTTLVRLLLFCLNFHIYEWKSNISLVDLSLIKHMDDSMLNYIMDALTSRIGTQ
jgi:hypothetical protein